ncbi:MAG: carbon-nitrogen hydrolase family protein [Phycisphaerae bacterium]|nr:carbon-nitrogen hydrolase family protein [Phycisphaerae bacterium]
MRVACAQLEAVGMDAASGVWPRVESMAERAKAANADLLVYPEVVYPSYWLESADRYRHADIERTPAVIARFSRQAAAHRIWIVAGIVEEDGERLFNTAAVFDRTGRLVQLVRKQFMWDCDRRWFSAGEESVVINTELGRMGVQICADLRMPEITATLAARGAEFVVQPTAWVNASANEGSYANIQPDFLLAARAIEFGLPFISCSKSGHEASGMSYVGQSRIVDADGMTKSTAGIHRDELVVAELQPKSPRPQAISQQLRSRLLDRQSPFGNVPTDRVAEIECRRGTSEVVASLAMQHARVVVMPCGALQCFAAARCAALDGAQVIVADRGKCDERIARARAAENRVFVIAGDDRAIDLVVEPSGGVLRRAADENRKIRLALGEADRKAFTPTTDIWSQRRVGSYQLP